MSTEAQKEKLWSGGYVYFLFLIFIIQNVFGQTQPLVPGFMINELGTTRTTAGGITSIFALVCLFTRPLSGVTGDRLSKKALTIIATFLCGVAVVLYSIAQDSSWIIPIRIFHGVTFAFSLTIAFAMAVAFVPKSRFGEGIGFLSVSTLVGGVLGPNFGLNIQSAVGYKTTFMISGTILALAGLSMIFFKRVYPALPPGAPKPQPRPISFTSFIAPELLPLVFFVMIASFPPGLNGAFLPVLGRERGISGFALFFIMNAVVQLATRQKVGRLLDQKGVAFIAIPGYILFAIGMLGIGFSHTLPMLLGSAAIMALGLSTQPALQTDCMKMLDPSRRALASGMFFMGIDLGQGVGQAVGGMLIDKVGLTNTYIAFSAALLSGCLLYSMYVSARKKRQQAAAA